MNRRLRKKIWICTDVWMDILPSFDRPQLGLKMALISDRFDVLVDAHFDGKSELTISNWTMISKDKGPESKLFVRIDDNFVAFPFPDRPLPNKIRFRLLQIFYIDHCVLAFLRFNKQIWDRMGTKVELDIANVQPIWDVLTSEIWPIFVPNIRHLRFLNGDHLDNLRRRTSPTILTDLDQLISICSCGLFPDAIAADDEPNATARHVLSKWVHTPSKSGQPKRLFCEDFTTNIEWINGFKETFLRDTASVSYKIHIGISRPIKPIELFELVNERTQEKLTLEKVARFGIYWLLKRCPIIVGETVTDQQKKDQNWDDHLNNVQFILWGGSTNCIGPLSPPAEKKKRRTNENNENSLYLRNERFH